MLVDTCNIPDRRPLRFTSIDKVIADINQLADAEQRGQLRSLGNWTFGQMLGHLAAWVGYAYDGMPMKVPWFVRLLMRPMKRRMLYQAMRPGLRIPRTKDGTLGTDPMSSEEGLRRCLQACDRLKHEPPTRPHIFFGRMTHDEWINLHLRHAECHLSLFKAD